MVPIILINSSTLPVPTMIKMCRFLFKTGGFAHLNVLVPTQMKKKQKNKKPKTTTTNNQRKTTNKPLQEGQKISVSLI